MPTLINMKMSAEEVKEETQPSAASAPEYPWGLCLDLDDEQLGKLGLKALPTVGAEIHIVAKGTVTSTSAYDRQDGDSEQRMSVQITDMAIANLEMLSADRQMQNLYLSTFGKK